MARRSGERQSARRLSGGGPRPLTAAIVVMFSLLSLFSLVPTAVCALDQELEITGDVRLRLRYNDSPDTGSLAGTYGEALKKGFSFRDRFVLEVAYSVSENVQAGGMVRVSNEGDSVLLAGPEYLSSELGSAFIAYETPVVRARLGYYQTSYTPLTLMRWDVDDDPEGGGAGCGCPGAPSVAGVILGETLEELGPTLTFEGARVSLSPGETFGFDAFLARPRPAGSDYQLATYGGRASVTQYLGRAASPFDLGLIAVRSEEDGSSLTGSRQLVGEPMTNTVVGLTWRAPLSRILALDGEWTLTKTSGGVERKGRGGIISLGIAPSRALAVSASYIYLSPNWDSYFRALSYSPDREGPRVAAEFTGGKVRVAAFAKYLRTVDPLSDEDTRHTVYPTTSLRCYLKVSPALDLGLGAIFAGSDIDDGWKLDVADKKLTLIGSLTFEFAKDSAITLEERLISNRVDKTTPTQRDYDISMLSLYVRSAIW